MIFTGLREQYPLFLSSFFLFYPITGNTYIIKLKELIAAVSLEMGMLIFVYIVYVFLYHDTTGKIRLF